MLLTLSLSAGLSGRAHSIDTSYRMQPQAPRHAISLPELGDSWLISPAKV